VATGTLVHELHFWFSTKYLDEETGLYYYGYRYYLPTLGHWINRDSIEEDGGLNVYSFTYNATIDHFDSLGQSAYSNLRDYFRSTLDFSFWGTRGCYNVCFGALTPATQVCLSLCGSVDVRGCCQARRNKLCMIGNITLEVGLFAIGTKGPREGFSPPPENWIKPISIKDIMDRPHMLGTWFRVPVRHGLEFGACPQEGLTGNLTAAISIGVWSWSAGVRGWMYFPGGNWRIQAGMNVSQGTGVSGGGGITYTYCFDEN